MRKMVDLPEDSVDVDGVAEAGSLRGASLL